MLRLLFGYYYFWFRCAMQLLSLQTSWYMQRGVYVAVYTFIIVMHEGIVMLEQVRPFSHLCCKLLSLKLLTTFVVKTHQFDNKKTCPNTFAHVVRRFLIPFKAFSLLSKTCFLFRFKLKALTSSSRRLILLYESGAGQIISKSSTFLSLAGRMENGGQVMNLF